MACKNSIPTRRCGDCFYINREAYRGAGVKVCYELSSNNELQKSATVVSEARKACNKFVKANRLSVAN